MVPAFLSTLSVMVLRIVETGLMRHTPAAEIKNVKRTGSAVCTEHASLATPPVITCRTVLTTLMNFYHGAGTNLCMFEASILVEHLYSQSRGFMFYSVPHRGSPLADIKTPVTARSVDLLEIAKDCPLVLELHSRWLRATQSRTDADNNVVTDTDGDGPQRVRVRSFVETCRTLMSVLWLRIVSTHSADAGIGQLTGVAVDHREVCKPSSRHCLLYTELADLIHDAIHCKC